MSPLVRRVRQVYTLTRAHLHNEFLQLARVYSEQFTVNTISTPTAGMHDMLATVRVAVGTQKYHHDKHSLPNHTKLKLKACEDYSLFCASLIGYIAKHALLVSTVAATCIHPHFSLTLQTPPASQSMCQCCSSQEEPSETNKQTNKQINKVETSVMLLLDKSK